MVLGKLHSHMQNNNSGVISHFIQKLTKKWIESLHIRPETVKLPEKHSGEKTLIDTGLGNNFFDYDTKSTGDKNKNRRAE